MLRENITKKTKIVCTIGPSSQDPKMLRKLLENGMNVVRLNFSHGDFEEHRVKISISQSCLILKDLKLELTT